MNILVSGITSIVESELGRNSDSVTSSSEIQKQDERSTIGTTFLSKYGSENDTWIMLQDSHSSGTKTIAFAQITEQKMSELATMLSELNDAISLNNDSIADGKISEIQAFVAANTEFLPRLYLAENNSGSETDPSSVGNFLSVLSVEGTASGQMAAFEVDMNDVFNSDHAADGCPLCQQEMRNISNGEVPSATTDGGSTAGSISYTSGTGDGSRGVDALAGGSKWYLDSDDMLNYSFYLGDGNDSHWDSTAYALSTANTVYTDAFALTSAQMTSARNAFNAWDAVTGFTLEEITEDFSSDLVGEIRMANALTTHSSFGGQGVGGIQAYAYFPGTNARSGDIWIGDPSDRTLNALTDVGRIGNDTISHEFGHAIGLKHPQDGTNNISGATDDTNRYSIMSYGQDATYDRNAIIDSDGSIERLAPSTPMIYDIAAAQYLYGEETTANTGDTTYSFTDGEVFIKSIYDAGGTDTVDASSQSTQSIIDLTPGSLSSIGLRTVSEMYVYWGAQDNGRTSSYVQSLIELNESSIDGNSIFGTSDGSLDSSGGMYLGQENFGISINAVIENALGGAGDDTITGNTADNELTGNAGDDTIDGGDGTDTAVFTGNYADYTIQTSGSGYTVTDGESNRDGTDTITNIEQLKFADQIYTLATGATIANGDTGSASFAEILERGSYKAIVKTGVATGSATFTEIITAGSDKKASGGSYIRPAMGQPGMGLAGPHGMGALGQLNLFGSASSKTVSAVQNSVSRMQSNLQGIQSSIANSLTSGRSLATGNDGQQSMARDIISAMQRNSQTTGQLYKSVDSNYVAALLRT